MICILGPLLVYVCATLDHKITRKEFNNLAVCFCVTQVWCQLVTNLIKITVGRPRPDFFGRCIGNHNLPPTVSTLQWEAGIVGGHARCAGVDSAMYEAYMSFPSGHASLAFSGLSHLTWSVMYESYEAAQMPMTSKGHPLVRYIIASAPLVLATWIAATGVSDMCAPSMVPWNHRSKYHLNISIHIHKI